MLEFRFINHSQLEKVDLLRICEIKAISWPFSLESQKDWIDGNVEAADIHVMMEYSGELLAYLCLTKRIIEINLASQSVIGVGNVCCRNSGLGHGRQLLFATNSYLNENDNIGMLFCKTSIIPFYQKCHWKLVDGKKVHFANKNSTNFQIMIFNLKLPVESILFSGKVF